MKRKNINKKTEGKINVFLVLAILIFGLQFFGKNAYSESQAQVPGHGVVVATSAGLTNLQYNAGMGAYQKQAELALAEIDKIVRSGNDYFVTAGNVLIRVNGQLEKSVSRKFEKISAIAANNNNIFISAENSLIVLDKDLVELSRVKLEINGYAKDAHDILIYGDSAYLLDNVMLPVFILKVDIKDVKNISIKEKIRIAEDVWPHLDGQWLNPGLNQWIVLQSYSGGTGGGVKAHIYALDKVGPELGSGKIFSETNYPQVSKDGYRIKSVTSLPPVWAVVQSSEGKNSLARVNSAGNKVSFSDFLDLEELNTLKNLSSPEPGIDRKVIVKEQRGYLFAAFTYSGTETSFDPEHNWRSESGFTAGKLMLIDIQAKPKVIFSRSLKEFNVQDIIDILPY